MLIENNNLKEKFINFLNSQGIGNFSLNEKTQKTVCPVVNHKCDSERKIIKINVKKKICCCKEVKEVKSIVNSFTSTEFVDINKIEQCV